MLKIENDILIIENHDFDHIMSWSDNLCPSEAFKEGLKIELSSVNVNEKEYKQINLKLD